MRNSFIHGLVGLFILLIQTSIISAATIAVNSDENIQADDGKCTLREAILASNNDVVSGSMTGECAAGDSASDLIEFSTLLIPAFIDVGLAVLPKVTESVSIVGPGLNDLVILGNNNDAIFRSEARLSISGLSIQSGGGYGSGVRMEQGSTLSLSECEFSGHTPADGGGVVHFLGLPETAFLTVNNCQFVGNNQTNGAGAAIYLSAQVGSTSIDAQISASSFINNQTNGSGGAISVFNEFNSFTLLHIEDSQFIGNSANLNGGAIYTNRTGLTVVIERSSFIGNHATADGGALYLANVSSVLLNSTIDGNSSGGNAGGVSLFAGSGDVSLIIHSTITANTANTEDDNGKGGGLVALGNVNIRNSVIAQNEVEFGSESPDCFGSADSEGYNLIGDVVDCSLNSDPSDLLGDSSGSGVLDPMLKPLANNGGLTLTRLPKTDSPLIDVIAVAACTDHEDQALELDQRSSLRPEDGDDDGDFFCDIGAVEVVFDGDLIFQDGFE